MKLDKSPFVVVSVIGQELLTHGFHGAAVVVLEAGLKIGTCSLKLRGSVFSALSSAYWSLGNTEKSMAYMQQDLEVTKTLGMEEEEATLHHVIRFCRDEQFVVKVSIHRWPIRRMQSSREPWLRPLLQRQLQRSFGQSQKPAGASDEAQGPRGTHACATWSCGVASVQVEFHSLALNSVCYMFLSAFIGSRKFPLISLVEQLKGRTLVQ